MLLDPWQEEVLNHRGHMVLCTGRQVGKTTIMAIKCAEYMIAHPGSQIIIVSLTEDQAKLIIVMILDYLQKNHKPYLKGMKSTDKTQNRIKTNNKSVALARPVGNTGDAVRGFTGQVLVIDEASRMPELAFIAAKPTLASTGGEIWMCSTPHGKTGYFYESWLNKNKMFRVFHETTEEVYKERAISQEWTVERKKGANDFLNEEKKEMGALSYGQEYLGLFLDDLRRFFTDALIERCCTLKRPNMVPDTHNFLGVDIARMGEDSSTFQIVTKVSDTRHQHVESEITKKTYTTETERRIIEIAQKWKVRQVGIDAGAGTLGVSVLDHLLDKYSPIKHKVVALNNRKIMMDKSDKPQTQRLLQEDMYNNLNSMMEHGEIQLLDDPEVQASLRAIQYEYITSPNKKSKLRIFATKHTESDVIEGLIRAAWLSRKSITLKLFATYSNDSKDVI